MNSLHRCIVTMLVSFSVFASASQVLAQSSAAREAAIHRCMLEAIKEYPRLGPDDSDLARTLVYKNCMSAAGFAP
jgi:hypothetical protein